jgi:hypothetical protein
MTGNNDDRTAWRYYVGAALTGFIERYGDDGLSVKAAYAIADDMLAAEKERFPDMEAKAVAAKIERELAEFKKQQPDPLAGTANDGE